MRNNFLAGATLVAGALLLVACGGLQKPTNNGNNNDTNDTGYTPPADYPKGPYGVSTGSTIADIGLQGIVNPYGFMTNSSTSSESFNTAIASIHLSDFRGKVPVLMVTAAAGWCEYCNDEEPSIVSYYDSLNGISGSNITPDKLGILEALTNNDSLNQPADPSFLKQWVQGNDNADGANMPYNVTFDLALDPDGEVLSPYYQESAFPMHMLITTADMQIREEFVGENDTGLQSAVTALLHCATINDASACN